MRKRFDAGLAELLDGAGRTCRVLLAVSGGVDSMTMAELFSGSSVSCSCAVAHMNFSLRGAAGDGDEALVRQWCAGRGVRLHCKRVDTLRYASENGLSVEMAARELRYGWFEELSLEFDYEFVAVAHNLNDSVETMYLNLLRGTGLRGLSGIRRRNGRIIRPLLQFTRDEIVSFANCNSVVWREDATNAGTLYSRNRIRNVVFPQLELINPSFLATSAEEMRRFADAQSILDDYFGSFVGSAVSSDARGVVSVGIPALIASGHTDYLLFRTMEGYGFNSSQVAQMASSLCASGARRFVSPTHVAVKDRESIKIYPVGLSAKEYSTRIFIRPDGFNPECAPSGVLYADADALDGEIAFRASRPGDRFVPLGMKGSRLVSDFLADLKLDVEAKGLERVAVVRKEDGSEVIAAVAGRRVGDRFKVTPSTKRILEIYCPSDESSSAS